MVLQTQDVRETFVPSSVERYDVVVSPVSQLARHLSTMRPLNYLLQVLLMITLFKQ
jgi:hypothetical protein